MSYEMRVQASLLLAPFQQENWSAPHFLVHLLRQFRKRVILRSSAVGHVYPRRTRRCIRSASGSSANCEAELDCTRASTTSLGSLRPLPTRTLPDPKTHRVADWETTRCIRSPTDLPVPRGLPSFPLGQAIPSRPSK